MTESEAWLACAEAWSEPVGDLAYRTFPRYQADHGHRFACGICSSVVAVAGASTVWAQMIARIRDLGRLTDEAFFWGQTWEDAMTRAKVCRIFYWAALEEERDVEHAVGC